MKRSLTLFGFLIFLLGLSSLGKIGLTIQAPVGTGVIETTLVAIALSTIGFMLMLAGVVL